MKKYVTRDEAVSMLLDRDLELVDLKDVLLHGCKGLAGCTNADLATDLHNYFKGDWVICDTMIECLGVFMDELVTMVEETMLDELEKTGYNSKYDLKLEVNGTSIALGMNADTYERLVKFLSEELKEMNE